MAALDDWQSFSGVLARLKSRGTRSADSLVRALDFGIESFLFHLVERVTKFCRADTYIALEWQKNNSHPRQNRRIKRALSQPRQLSRARRRSQAHSRNPGNRKRFRHSRRLNCLPCHSLLPVSPPRHRPSRLAWRRKPGRRALRPPRSRRSRKAQRRRAGPQNQSCRRKPCRWLRSNRLR